MSTILELMQLAFREAGFQTVIIDDQPTPQPTRWFRTVSRMAIYCWSNEGDSYLGSIAVREDDSISVWIGFEKTGPAFTENYDPADRSFDPQKIIEQFTRWSQRGQYGEQD